MSVERSGNRHLRDHPDSKLGSLKPGFRTVVVCANREYAASIEGQHLLQMLVQLLCRQFGVIEKVLLDVPLCAVHKQCFPLGTSEDNSNLRTRLLQLGSEVGGDELLVSVLNEASTGIAAQVSIGNIDRKDSNLYTVSAFGEGWTFFCSDQREAPTSNLSGNGCIGSYMAACYAAGAVFKFLHGFSSYTDLVGDIFSCSIGDWKELRNASIPTSFQIPDVLMIGAGAVGAAACMTLAASEAAGDLVVLDPQNMDETNRNRLVSGRFKDVERPKATLAKELFKHSLIRVYPCIDRWPEYSADSARRIPERFRQRENQDRYEWILSCVDHNLDRRNIAKFFPRHVLGGSTEGFAAQVSYYSFHGERECLACHHPLKALNSVEEIRAMLQSWSPLQRTEWYARHDVPQESAHSIETDLHKPDCGTLAAAEMERIGRDGEPAWSVGFVSVAAGVLQAASLIRASILGVEEAFAHYSEIYAWFLNSDIGSSRVLRNATCEMCSTPARQDRYNHLWP